MPTLTIISKKGLLWLSSLLLLIVIVWFILSYNDVKTKPFAYEAEFKAYLQATFSIQKTSATYFVMPVASCAYCRQKSYEVLNEISPTTNMILVLVGDFREVGAAAEQIALLNLPFNKLHDVHQRAYQFGFGLAKPMIIHMKNNHCIWAREISDDLIERIPDMLGRF